MYLKKFNDIIFELIDECLNYTACKRLDSLIERKTKLSELSNLTEKLNIESYLNEKERETFIELMTFLSKCLSRKGCNDYQMPKNFSKFELDKINKEFHDFNGDPEEYNPKEDFSTTSDFIIIFYIKEKYSIYFKHLDLSKNLKKF